MSSTGDRPSVARTGSRPAWADGAPFARVEAVARAGARVRPAWPLAAVLALYAAAAFVVPTLAPLATTDDWAYARSAQILYQEQRLEIFPVVAATAVFQVAWGALFAVLFEPTLGVFRLSTVVMTALGGWALYGLLRQMGVCPRRSALGTAAYLFNPLAFVLAYTFMTDPHFASLLLVSVYCYVKGLDRLGDGAWATVAGSGAAAAAFLTRQQGILIPLGVVTFLLLGRRVTGDRDGLLRLVQVGALPGIAVIGYYLWLRFGNDVPVVQESFFQEAIAAGWGGTWYLLRRLTFVETMYLGFAALPVVVVAVPALRRIAPPASRLGRWFLLAWAAVVVGGVVAAWGAGGRMPYIGQFLGAGGPGAPDVLGSRPRLFDAAALTGITIGCAVAAVLFAYLLARRVGVPAQERPKAGLVLAIGFWQVIGVFPPSYHYLNRGGSLDRYLLPLLPLGICLLLWALCDVRVVLPLGWAAVAAFAVLAVGGTRDYLVYMGGVWDLARQANAAGVPNDRLDAGSGWDGYHLYEYSRDHVPRARTKGGPWWVYFYAKATDSTYVVAGRPLPGYVKVTRRPYSSWLESEPTSLYLLRRPEAPWPPIPEPTSTSPPASRTAPVPSPAVEQSPTPFPTPAAESVPRRRDLPPPPQLDRGQP